jgi:hypothetical protein
LSFPETKFVLQGAEMAGGDADSGGRSGFGRRVGNVLGGTRTLQFFGIVTMLAVLAGLLVLLLTGVERSRAHYFQQRDLRELDRVAQDLSSTAGSLASIASLHFVPDQLRFGIGSTNECLVATTSIPGAAGQATRIDYEFPRQSLEQKKPPSSGTGPTAPGLPAPPQPGQDPCGVSVGDDLLAGFTGHELKLTRRLVLRDVLRPISIPQEGKDPFEYAWQRLREKAESDLKPIDPTIAGGAKALIGRSFDAAAAAGAIRVTVRADTRILDLDTVLTQFDAIQLLGPRPADGTKAPPLLLQAGVLPPSIRLGDVGVGTAFVKALAPTGGAKPVSPPSEATAPPRAPPGEATHSDSTVEDGGDVFFFRRDYASLGDGLGCLPSAPCSIVGVVAKSRFGATVRELEGLPTALFLIAAVTLAAFVPLIHLALLKRLDPVSKRMQYVTWFSLTLLAASASIAALTAWTLEGSRSVGRAYAVEKMKRIQSGFSHELDATLRAAVIIARSERGSREPYPAPAAAPWPWRDQPAGQAIIDTASVFGPDGRASPYHARFSSSLKPSFGTEIGDRSYFRRAVGKDFTTRRFSCLERTDRGVRTSTEFDLDFTIDRVFARPDGVPKTVVLLPTRQTCLRPRGPDEYLLLAGHLQTFLATSTPPAFRYAVIDPKRGADTPNILFHSRPDAELSETFQEDLEAGDRGAFQTLLEQLNDNCTSGPIRFATHYRGDPVILTLDRLDPQCGRRGVDWVLILIEHRKDVGFALWRAASFAYGTWVVAILLIFAVSVLVRMGARQALDRRPGLWLWPEDVLTEFTAPRFWRDELQRRTLGQAARLRDRHVVLVLAAGLTGVVFGSGAARTVFALAAVMGAFAGRAYFGGLTAADPSSGRKLDRWFIRFAFVLLGLSAATTVSELLLPASGPMSGWGSLIGDGVAAFGLTLALLNARRHASRPSDPVMPARRKPSERKGTQAPVWIRDPLPVGKRGYGRLGWMLMLIAVGILPATAGFLDSIDHSYSLVQARQWHRSVESEKRKDDSLNAINLARGVTPESGVPKIVTDRIGRGLLPGEASGRGPSERTPCAAAALEPHPRASDYSFAALAIGYLGLETEALEYSDHCPISPTATFGDFSRAPQDVPLALLGAFLPLALLLAALHYFRRQYFLAPPRTPVVTGDRFLPPLACPRKDFLDKVLLPAARGRKPAVPFDTDESKLHLILGASVDLEGDSRLETVEKRIQWVDLLDLADGKPLPAIAAETRVIMVQNLDLALQHASVRSHEMLTVLEDFTSATKKRPKQFLFILAEIEPLDRIALLRAQCGEEPAATLEHWRWARLLQDFTLCAVVPDMPAENEAEPSVASRELQMIDTPFAEALLRQLESGPQPVGHEAEDRMIDYIAEQMADYYHRLWTSSGNEERVLLYHIAWRRHLKLEDVPALRSLLVRGLLVRSPEYRLMNKSFARYVRRIEQPGRIYERACRAEGATDEIWPLIRVPLIALAGSMLILVQLLSPQQATGAIALVPALGAIIPTLLGSWLRPQASAS